MPRLKFGELIFREGAKEVFSTRLSREDIEVLRTLPEGVSTFIHEAIEERKRRDLLTTQKCGITPSVAKEIAESYVQQFEMSVEEMVEFDKQEGKKLGRQYYWDFRMNSDVLRKIDDLKPPTNLEHLSQEAKAFLQKLAEMSETFNAVKLIRNETRFLLLKRYEELFHASPSEDWEQW